jgi:hypothetical protein
LNESGVCFGASLAFNESANYKRFSFPSYSTRNIIIRQSIHQMPPCSAAHLVHVAAPRAVTALPKVFTELPILNTPFTELV